jgi:hypothetical protein
VLGESSEKEVVIRSTDKTPFTIEKVEKQSQHVETELEPVQGEENAYKLKVKILPTLPIGRLGGSVKVHTSHPKKPVLDIYFHGNVMGPIAYSPQYPRFRKNEAGQKLYISLRASRSNTFNILKISGPEEIETNTKVLQEGKQYNVEVVLTNPLKTNYKNMLTIETDEPKQPKIMLPITLSIPPAKGAPRAAPPGGLKKK